jgi:hypothetical protein
MNAKVPKPATPSGRRLAYVAGLAFWTCETPRAPRPDDKKKETKR